MMIRRWTLVVFLAGCGPVVAGDAGVDGGQADAAPDAALPCLAPHSVAAHGACRCSGDCAGDAFCYAESAFGFPAGECIPPPCHSDADCPAGPCEAVAGVSEGLCRVRCESRADCRAGRQCVQGICAVWCTQGSDCESGHCNPHTHRCDAGPPRSGRDNGERCLDGDDCLSGLCDDVNLGGRCASLCLPGLDDCPAGSACIVDGPDAELGLCLRTCLEIDDCGDGLDCVQSAGPSAARVCFREPSGSSCLGRDRVVLDGANCGCGEDCFFGYRCLDEWFYDVPHGMCVRTCDDMGMTVSDDPSCGEGLLCHDWIFGGAACWPRCTASADCPRGRICSWTEGCLPFCQSDDECLSGVCDRYLGWCSENRNPDRGGIGAPCSLGRDCRSISCRRNSGTGFCTAECDVGRQACPDGAVCVDVGDGPHGRCMPPCETAEDCAIAGTECHTPSDPGARRYCDFPSG